VVGSHIRLQFKKNSPTALLVKSVTDISVFQAAVSRIGLGLEIKIKQIGALAVMRPVCVVSHLCEARFQYLLLNVLRTLFVALSIEMKFGKIEALAFMQPVCVVSHLCEDRFQYF